MPRYFKQPDQGFYKIRAYCAVCGKLLQESNPLTQKQLVTNWNDAVINSMQILCKDCKTKLPNYKLTLKVVDTRYNDERVPADWPFLKLDEKTADERVRKAFAMFKEEARKQAEEAGINTEISEEEIEAMKQATPVTVDILEDGTAVVPVEDMQSAIKEESEKRRKKNEERRADRKGTDGAVQTDESAD